MRSRAATILHVDMDAFYASVETIKAPELRGRPVIVGGRGSRGVVTSASYEARSFGVRSAMPIVRARRLCPQGIFLPNDFDAYQEYSRRIKDVFMTFTPLVESLSLDEAFLDVAGSIRLLGTPREIGMQIKDAIRSLGLACTVGIAPNKFIAKLASSRAKPDGLLEVPAQDVVAWLHPLPAGALWGVGQQTADTLRRLGLKTIGDIASMPRRTLERAVGDALGHHLHDLAQGRDEREVRPDEPAKSVSSEMTFDRDIDHESVAERELLRLADRTATRLRSRTLCGRTVSIKVRFSNFQTITRAATLTEEVDTTAEIYETAKQLFAKVSAGGEIGRGSRRIRLLGVGVSGLAPGPPRRQLGFFESGAARRRDVVRAVDRVRARFGDGAVQPAALLRDESSL